MSLEVHFLDRSVYANGHVSEYWEQADLRNTQPQLVILHNNWIKVCSIAASMLSVLRLAYLTSLFEQGLNAKVQRFFQHKMWMYDRAQEVCFYGSDPPFVFDWSLDDVNL